jgi:hypothetical protein
MSRKNVIDFSVNLLCLDWRFAQYKKVQDFFASQ